MDYDLKNKDICKKINKKIIIEYSIIILSVFLWIFMANQLTGDSSKLDDFLMVYLLY